MLFCVWVINMRDFIKKAIAEGKVKKYEEVKYTDPNLLEHDDLGFYIGEQVTKYGGYDIGDIVFVKKFTYEDGTPGERHLFVIVDKENYAVPMTYFAFLISSRLEKLKYKDNVFMKKTKFNGLDRDSIVKTDSVYEFENESIEFKIGRVEDGLVEKFMKYYMDGGKDD